MIILMYVCKKEEAKSNKSKERFIDAREIIQ